MGLQGDEGGLKDAANANAHDEKGNDDDAGACLTSVYEGKAGAAGSRVSTFCKKKIRCSSDLQRPHAKAKTYHYAVALVSRDPEAREGRDDALEAKQGDEKKGGVDDGETMSVLQIQWDIVDGGLVDEAKEEALSQQHNDDGIAIYGDLFPISQSLLVVLWTGSCGH